MAEGRKTVADIELLKSLNCLVAQEYYDCHLYQPKADEPAEANPAGEIISIPTIY